MTPVRVAIAGCSGRMGRALVSLAPTVSGLQLAAAVTRSNDPQIGADSGRLGGGADNGIAISDRLVADCDVVVEFTTPEGCATWANWCAARHIALVSGTTGLTAAAREAQRTAAQTVPVVWAPNMSIGVNMLLGVCERMAAALGQGWDVEICEAHHRHKIDAPSGTARALLDAICRARGLDAEKAATPGRSGQVGPRGSGEIGVHALRMGDVVGEHEVHFATAGESIMLRHRASSRDAFAAGALRAARWAAGRAPGLYSMRDVLGL